MAGKHSSFIFLLINALDVQQREDNLRVRFRLTVGLMTNSAFYGAYKPSTVLV